MNTRRIHHSPVVWSGPVPPPQTEPISELNQKRNLNNPDDHLVRRVYCDPTETDGTRIIRYIVDGIDESTKLPRPVYQRSLDELLPPEIERAPWMKLTRHPLVWDGITTLDFTEDYVNVVPLLSLDESDDDTSMERAGLHWLPDIPNPNATGIDEKPPYDIAVLTKLAIIGSPYQTLIKAEIEELLINKFSWFKIYRYQSSFANPFSIRSIALVDAPTIKEPSSKKHYQKGRRNKSLGGPQLPWTTELGMLLSAGAQHMWLRPHPLPSSVPGMRVGPSYIIAGVPLRSDPKRLRLAEATQLASIIRASQKARASGGSRRGSSISTSNDNEDTRSIRSFSTAQTSNGFEAYDDDGFSSRSATRPYDSPFGTNAYDSTDDLTGFDDIVEIERKKAPKYKLVTYAQHPFLLCRLVETLPKAGFIVNVATLESARDLFVKEQDFDVLPEPQPRSLPFELPLIKLKASGRGASALGRCHTMEVPLLPTQRPTFDNGYSLRRTQSNSDMPREFGRADARESIFISGVVKRIARYISARRSGRV